MEECVVDVRHIVLPKVLLSSILLGKMIRKRGRISYNNRLARFL